MSTWNPWHLINICTLFKWVKRVKMAQVGMAGSSEYTPRYLQVFLEKNRIEKRDIRIRFSQLCILVFMSIYAQECGPSEARPARDWKPSLWYVCSFNGNLHIGIKIQVSKTRVWLWQWVLTVTVSFGSSRTHRKFLHFPGPSGFTPSLSESSDSQTSNTSEKSVQSHSFYCGYSVIHVFPLKITE